jgi:hypothetical protein
LDFWWLQPFRPIARLAEEKAQSQGQSRSLGQINSFHEGPVVISPGNGHGLGEVKQGNDLVQCVGNLLNHTATSFPGWDDSDEVSISGRGLWTRGGNWQTTIILGSNEPAIAKPPSRRQPRETEKSII